MAKTRTQKEAATTEVAAAPRHDDGLAAVGLPAGASVGEEFASLVLDAVEGDMRQEAASRKFRLATARLKKLKRDCEAAVAEVERDYSPEQAAMARLFLDSLREDLFKCFLVVSPAAGATAASREQLSALVDQLLDAYHARIADGAAAPLP